LWGLILFFSTASFFDTIFRGIIALSFVTIEEVDLFDSEDILFKSTI
jgi:hypothetical protein